ncbi:hypothetical protein HJG60_009373 [Phyllostomus discolor]|uniref:Secreted protein n=1 Tax=Phyllostomus discolor TaxID=89673 RepID=A0A833YJK8_9CHIR|nr:hypothetical protein HJG60_009373 [Phyllostomus discolor]
MRDSSGFCPLLSSSLLFLLVSSSILVTVGTTCVPAKHLRLDIRRLFKLGVSPIAASTDLFPLSQLACKLPTDFSWGFFCAQRTLEVPCRDPERRMESPERISAFSSPPASDPSIPGQLVLSLKYPTAANTCSFEAFPFTEEAGKLRLLGQIWLAVRFCK